MNEIIADKVSSVKYFKYRYLLFLAKDLIRAKQTKNEKLVNIINKGLNDLRNVIIRQGIPENKNPNIIVGIVERNLDFNKQQYRDRTLTCRTGEGGERKFFVGFMKFFRHILMGHEIFLKHFDGPQIFYYVLFLKFYFLS